MRNLKHHLAVHLSTQYEYNRYGYKHVNKKLKTSNGQANSFLEDDLWQEDISNQEDEVVHIENDKFSKMSTLNSFLLTLVSMKAT